MDQSENSIKFLEEISKSLKEEKFVKLTLSKPKSKGSPLKNIFVRSLVIRDEKVLSFVFRHETKDITKNFQEKEALGIIAENLGKLLMNGVLFTMDSDIQIMFNRKLKSTLLYQKPTQAITQPFRHDKIKRRLIAASGNVYLQKLGIASQEGHVIKSMSDKFRQINKYIEIIDDVLKNRELKTRLHVVDMGSGKGYLTFALYDYLVNNLSVDAEVTGIEIRPQLVDFCNNLAQECDFDGLHFVKSNISDFETETLDMLIALHACDTATDDAICKGISSGAEYIICAPCCHKQIRKQMKPENELSPVLKHGIFLERQAEMVTDGLRALIMEKYGYQTRVFEFISTEHTPKNLMIVGRKGHKKPDVEKIENQIHRIKQSFGIEQHYLEKLLLEI